jgi:two-component system sensor histidine kinase KdpD
LRTPLTALSGLAESLCMQPGQMTPDQSAMAQAMRDQAHRTSDLVTNILDMARLQSGQVRLKRDWQALEEIVGGAIKAREGLLAAHRIVTDLPADLPLVECDALLIERVLVNLLENAAKYTPAGSTITVAARPDGATLWVEVSDDGPGLPPGKEAAVFQKFMRGASESNIPGLGLGLAICRTIVEAHGGRITAENRPAPDTGARFRFTLPLKEAPPVAAEPT